METNSYLEIIITLNYLLALRNLLMLLECTEQKILRKLLTSAFMIFSRKEIFLCFSNIENGLIETKK